MSMTFWRLRKQRAAKLRAEQEAAQIQSTEKTSTAEKPKKGGVKRDKGTDTKS